VNSFIYEGKVRHSRVTPAANTFSYRVFMMYLDLKELPDLFSKYWLWSSDRPAIARFRRENHIGSSSQDLSDTIRDLVMKETGNRPEGPIRLLTNLAYFGYCFNPVSFYYCFSKDEKDLKYIVAEVNNTPWGERETYVMDCHGTESSGHSYQFNPIKKMHVSPFMPMRVDYEWLFNKPSKSLSVSMTNSKDGKSFFNASILLKRKRLNSISLAGVLIRFPFMTFKIILAIHWQALCLWLKRCPVYIHPAKKKESS
tara:strand:- start:119 stop:883 length:765 start_codon:yes stop_codon:yes gene_type:complete